MSAAPILMLGPGGDYVTRFDAQGKSLTRSVGNTWGQQPDTDSAGSFAGYTRMPKRGSAQSDKDEAKPSSATLSSAGPITRGRDTFEHAAPSRSAGTYQRNPSRDHGQPSTNLTLILSSLEAWLAAQQRALRELSASLAATLPTHRSAKPSPRDRVASMARGLSLGAFSGDPHRRGAICRLLQDTDPAAHAEATRDVIASIAPINTDSQADGSHLENEHDTEEALPANPAALEENDHEQHRHPQPHPQAASHPHPDPRPARGARLLADDAGAGGRAWREQGHGLRARRGADQERRALAAAQQGTLFGG